MSVADKYTTLTTEKIPSVFEAGKKSQYDEFWDSFQQNGDRKNYISAFGSQWTKETFKPKYPIRPTNANSMFFNNSGEGLDIEDFVEFCEENNIVLDFSNCISAQYGIGCLRSPHFGTLDFSKCTGLTYLFYAQNFNSTYSVRTIDNFISSEITKYTSTAFQGATKLENLTMSGVIASNGFDVSACTNLTHDSLMSIINALKDYSTDTSGTTWKVTLGSSNIAKLTTEELETIRSKGWTYA